MNQKAEISIIKLGKYLPALSMLRKELKSYQYIDSFASEFFDESNAIDITKVCKAFFSTSPAWIDAFFNFRNKIVKVFGLKTSGNIQDRKAKFANFKVNPGERMGLFKIIAKNEQEIILGEDDRHLNFRVSLFLENIGLTPGKKKLSISTTIKFNNGFGRLYFIPVKPFHKIIVPVMLISIIKNLTIKIQQ